MRDVSAVCKVTERTRIHRGLGSSAGSTRLVAWSRTKLEPHRFIWKRRLPRREKFWRKHPCRMDDGVAINLGPTPHLPEESAASKRLCRVISGALHRDDPNFPG